MKSRHSFIGPRNAHIISLNNTLFGVWLLDYMYIDETLVYCIDVLFSDLQVFA